MLKSAFLALAALAGFTPAMAQTSPFEKGLNTMWEVLWHQSGTATRLVRWEQDIKVRAFGGGAQARQDSVQTLREVAAVGGVKVIDVSSSPDAARMANVSIEIVPDAALSEDQPCETRLNFRTEAALDSVALQMRASDVKRCIYHESMHVMGVRGHPEGSTVLSYFEHHDGGLTGLDKVMLRAWYSPRAKGGMTPFEVMPILADELVAAMPDKARARAERDRFLARIVGEMQAFAEGEGDVPAIVKRSGKSSDLGIRFGRMEMSFFLGVAYQQGVGVAQDVAQASRWLRRAASLGSRSAITLLGAGGASVAGNR